MKSWDIARTGWIGPVGYGYAVSVRSAWGFTCRPFHNGSGYGVCIDCGRFSVGICIAF